LGEKLSQLIVKL